jgi:uncharacterized protein with GYD domain
MTVHAVVLIQCEIDEIAEAAGAIAEIGGVSEVYSVAGEFDLVAIVRVSEHDDLAKVIPGGISRVEGVERTETLIAFQVYSRHDLERMFSLGFEKMNPGSLQAYFNDRANPTGRFGRPEDIVNAGIYLASDESTWTNGAILVIDGGITSNYF